MAAAPVDWEKVELEYRAGIKTLRQIAEEHGISHVAVNKRAKRDGWVRDLSAKISSKAEEMVTKSMVTKEVTAAQKVTERETVESNAQAVANVIISHRSDIRRNRGLANKLLAELEAIVDDPDVFEQLGEMMASPDEKGQDKLNELYRKVTSLPSRVDSAKKLAETLKILVGLEREAFKIDNSADKPVNPIDELLKSLAGRSAIPVVRNV